MPSKTFVSVADSAAADPSVDEATLRYSSIDCLPYEIKKEIIRWTSVLPWSTSECRETQQSISLVNREFGALVNPFLWSSVEMAAPSIQEMSFFVSEIIPRHSHLVRRILFDYRRWEDFNRDRPSYAESYRCAIVEDIISGLPSLSHFGIMSGFWDEGSSDVFMLDAAIALGGRLRSLSIIDVGSDIVNPSYFASFLSHFTTLEELELAGVRRHKSDDFVIALSNLTRLRELSLRDVSLRRATHVRWRAALTRLSLEDCDGLPLRDAQNFIHAFSSTLTDLTLCITADLGFDPPDLLPFPPSDFPRLKNLRLDWCHAEESPLLISLARSPARYIEITIKHHAVFGRTDAQHLIAALAAFQPTLEEVRMTLSTYRDEPGWDTISKDVEAAYRMVARWCKAQVPEVVFSENLEEQLRPRGMIWSMEEPVDVEVE